MLTRKERTLLREAADLIVRELKEAGEVGISSFGKFYVSEVETARGLNQPGTSAPPMLSRNVVRFRPWEGLKRQVNNGEILIVQEAPGEMEHKQEQAFVGVQSSDQLYKACVYCEASIPAGSADCPECGLPQDV